MMIIMIIITLREFVVFIIITTGGIITTLGTPIRIGTPTTHINGG